jgi:ATP-binding protein involved in chromosome partitioning
MSTAGDSVNKASACGSCGKQDCSAKQARPGESPEDLHERQALQRRMCQIQHKLLVLSGKGGVGKSTVAVNLAVWLALQGKRVGLLDIDIHGPSVPKLLGLEGAPVHGGEQSIEPVRWRELAVMSIGFLLRDEREAVIWRGPRKMGVIKQFLSDVEWGELDYLVVDAPPGTGDEPLSVCQLLAGADGAVIVTTPQEVALSAVRKSITFCRQLELPVLGVVENMSGYVCPKCGERSDIFSSGGGERMAREMRVPFLGRIPIDPRLGQACDQGQPFMQGQADSPTGRELGKVFASLLARPAKRG